MIRRRVVPVLTMLLAGLLLLGCDTPGTEQPLEGEFTLVLTDAPAGLDSAVVTIERVTLIGERDDKEEEAEEVTVLDTPATFDLLRLRNGTAAFLADRVAVPEGGYTQLRLSLGPPHYVVVDGRQVPLTVPRDVASELRVVLPEIEVEENGDRLAVTLDIDVEESVRQISSDEYELRPALRVQSVVENGVPIRTVSVEGPVSGVQASSGRLSVDGIEFTTTPGTVVGGDDGVSALDDLTTDQFVDVEGTILEDGTLEARDIETGEADDRSVIAPVESIRDGALSLLGRAFRVTRDTEFDDPRRLGALTVGEQVEVDYVLVNGTRTAVSVERELD